ncbi:DUF302 domain-containing protein [[Haemophilus] ducreyi]|uniref:DUF302 domain-containing protein n=1 Tax=Haemophilus ducreyi TaxID=730 RepID=UPI00065620F2|nr:DUF302 domain-containing protein [[Haemophilus] ducreyi]AKO44987.1 hypothetical protein RZ66_01470 [[Haemophilus] ducreyi]AKO46390.1 hypothetical protein RZ67_01455 [[Haemophilus] ducreyi]AKO47735.1 hypothetical protein RZ68_01465 [[Haemophilus] ducreyi]AKO49117.1 hypothetical protein RZ69_01460 [[Haemophilus] ducreyi]OOS03068.1 hypothetical protein B0190_06095 [[Haemophilus] ducreyi]
MSLLLPTFAMAEQNLKPQVFESKFDFQQTLSTLEETFLQKGMKIFTKIDHQAAAKAVGLTMQPATVLIYGTPQVGTALMIKDPLLALQLPLKVLVTEANARHVEVILNNAEQIVAHTNTPYKEVENSLAKAEKLIQTTIAK